MQTPPSAPTVALGPSSSAADAQLLSRQLEAWKLSLIQSFTSAVATAAKTSVDANGGTLHQPSFQKAAQAPLALALTLHRASLSPNGEEGVSVLALALNAIDEAVKSPIADSPLPSASTSDIVEYASGLADKIHIALVESLKLSISFAPPSKETAYEEIISSCLAPLSTALAKHDDADGAKKDLKAFVQRLYSLCNIVDSSGRRFVDALHAQSPSYIKSTLEWSDMDVTRAVLIRICQEPDTKKRETAWKAKLEPLALALYQAWRDERKAAQAATVAKTTAAKVVVDKAAALSTPPAQAPIPSSGAAPTAPGQPRSKSAEPRRPCKHCAGDHLDRLCPTPKCVNCGDIMTEANGPPLRVFHL
jgi:hypothetical protein